MKYFEELDHQLPVVLFTNDLRSIREVIQYSDNIKKTIIVTDVVIQSKHNDQTVMNYEKYFDYLSKNGIIEGVNLIFGPSRNEMALKKILTSTVDTLRSKKVCWFIDDTELQFVTNIRQTILAIKSSKTKSDLYYSTISKNGVCNATYLKAFNEFVTSQISDDTYRMLNFFALSKGWHEADIKKHIRRLHGNYIFELSQYYSILNQNEFVPMFDVKTKQEVSLKEIEAASKRASLTQAPNTVNEVEQIKLFTEKKFGRDDQRDLMAIIEENRNENKLAAGQVLDTLKKIQISLEALGTSLSDERSGNLLSRLESLAEELKHQSFAAENVLNGVRETHAETHGKSREPPTRADTDAKELHSLLLTIATGKDDLLQNVLELKTMFSESKVSETEEFLIDEDVLKRIVQTVIIEMNDVTDFYDKTCSEKVKTSGNSSGPMTTISMAERLEKRFKKNK